VENRRPEADALLREAYALTRAVPVIGLTGPPGAGKSTLVDLVALHWAERGERVAVLAVDPSSPYTGGAVLGDRFRMDKASAHPNVFVRSLSSRGHVGGLSRAVQDIVTVLGALDFDRVLVETVGSGQSDIEVAQLADCVVVVSVPGLGDQMQAAKAGILEIGDAYAVNKSDLPGAETVAGHLTANLDLIYPGVGGVNDETVSGHGVLAANAALHQRHGQAQQGEAFWRPPVLRVSARQGSGVAELAAACDAFLAWQQRSGRAPLRRAERRRQQLLRLVTARLLDAAAGQALAPALEAQMQALSAGRCTPDEAADGVIEALCGVWIRQRGFGAPR
jgi:LAO/AO transport system kinase